MADHLGRATGRGRDHRDADGKGLQDDMGQPLVTAGQGEDVGPGHLGQDPAPADPAGKNNPIGQAQSLGQTNQPGPVRSVAQDRRRTSGPSSAKAAMR